MEKELLQRYFDEVAGVRPKWERKNRGYHRMLERYFAYLIPANSRVIEIGCGTGNLLASVKPVRGVGVDFSPGVVELARANHPHLEFLLQDAAQLSTDETFDYVIISDLVGSLWDVQTVFEQIRLLCHTRTRIVVSYYNYLWEPMMRLGELFGLKQKQPLQNWLSTRDITNLFTLTGFEVVRTDKKILLPYRVPVLAWFLNSFLANMPIFRSLAMINLIIARPAREVKSDYTVSIVIPARNERGNIENAILRTPMFGAAQEFIFVEGNSSDGTFEEMVRVKTQFPEKNIKIMRQSGKGKGNAVREGFEKSEGDILFILDADLTTPPEDLPKFYQALSRNRGEFINGCRLVYPMEKQAMRWLNLIANKLFGLTFSYLLGQKVKDTLCGTKVLFRKDYQTIRDNRSYFGDFDPFGDFDLLFGAAKLNLKIVEINVRYKDRQYGTTQISRFKHGLLLLRMTIFAARKLKFF